MPYVLGVVWHEAVLNTTEYPGLCQGVLFVDDAGVAHHSTRSVADSDAAKAGRARAMASEYERVLREGPGKGEFGAKAWENLDGGGRGTYVEDVRRRGEMSSHRVQTREQEIRASPGLAEDDEREKH